MPGLTEVLGLGANLDGQQWIWVVMVLVGAAVVAAVMVFGRQRQALTDRKRAAKDRDQDTGNPQDIDEVGDEPGPQHPES